MRAVAGGLLFGFAMALAPVLAGAQGTSKTQRIGVLMQTTPAAASHIATAFSHELGQLGHVEGKNVVLEYRWAEGKPERFPALVAELVRLKVDVIIASALPAAEAARQATTAIPIVMVNAADPIESGLIRSLAQPGGNVTGLSAILTPEIRAKQLQLLKEALPGLTRLAILRRAAVATATLWNDYEAAGRALELKVQFVDVQGDALDRAFDTIAADRAGAVLVPGDAVFFTQRQRIVGLAAERRLPGMFSSREFTDAGGLMSYSARLTDLFRRAAVYADKILKGASPATLPVESPTEFELVINLRTAKALKLAIPPAFLVRADQVIQ